MLIFYKLSVDVQGMKAEDLCQILMEMDDFKYEKTLVVEQILKVRRGHRCIFLFKHHCEFKHIERILQAGKDVL